MSPSRKIYDALIIGGGPAGLSAALGLGRIGRTCMVFSNGRFRNDGIEASHAVLGHDHVHPQKIWAQGRQQIERYGNTTFVEADITEVERKEIEELGGRHGFVAANNKGDKWYGRTLVMATGIKDVFPDLPGFAENWPQNIYQCLFCDGYERRTMPRGILCIPSFNPSVAKVASQLLHLDPQHTSKVTVFANGDPNPSKDPATEKALKQLAANGIDVDTRKIVRLEKSGQEEHGTYVHLKDVDGKEDKVFQAFVFHKPRTMPNALHLIKQLGLETATSPYGDYIKTEGPFQGTKVPGVFSAGDAGVLLTHVTNALLTGVGTAGGISFFLNDWDDEIAMEAYSKTANEV